MKSGSATETVDRPSTAFLPRRRWCEVHQIGVVPEQLREGIARGLVQAVLRAAAESGDLDGYSSRIVGMSGSAVSLPLRGLDEVHPNPIVLRGGTAVSAMLEADLLGTEERDKKHFIARGGHYIPRAVSTRETLEWFDRYLGHVR